MRTRYLGAALASMWMMAAALTVDLAEARGDAGGYYKLPFGSRELHSGNQGGDVKTLNWVLRSQGLNAPFLDIFNGETDVAVRSLQAAAGLPSDGVVGHSTMKAIAVRMPRERSTWYGPGLWGKRTACGVPLTPRTVGIAHPSLPCGTRVALAYRGRWRRARVIDRGPYRAGYGLDLTRRLAKRLAVLKAGTATVKVGVAQ